MKKRLFTALRFPKNTINEIDILQKSLMKEDPKARFVTPVENFHLTLFFIGMTDRLEDCEEALKNACLLYKEQIGRPITLEFDRLGTFRSKGGSVLWLGIKENKDLETLAGLIPKELDPFGIEGDRKKFRAHITLARKFRGEIPTSVTLPEPITLDKAYLVWSHRNEDDVLVYDNLKDFNFVR